MIKKQQFLKKKLALVVLGRSGSGKGTQAKFILKRLGSGVCHLETGRFLRSFIAHYSNPTVLVAKKIMKKGGILPSWFPIYTWLKRFIEEGCGNKHLVFDGAPRKVLEAEIMDDVVKWHGRSLPLCIYVDVSEKEAIKRLLLRARSDDKVSAIRNRLKFFKNDVVPVVNYYKNHGRLIRVDGNPPVEKVWEQIDSALKKRLGRNWPH